jgi:hypothetical protein
LLKWRKRLKRTQTPSTTFLGSIYLPPNTRLLYIMKEISFLTLITTGYPPPATRYSAEWNSQIICVFVRLQLSERCSEMLSKSKRRKMSEKTKLLPQSLSKSLWLVHERCVCTTLWNSLIIHEENTKEIMSVKEFVYLIQNHAHLHKL